MSENKEYNFKQVEKKWQKLWNDNSCHTPNFTNIENKHYCLTMFSYPSGDKLHVGHWYNYGPVDTYARYLKKKGLNVFQPQGFDSFGLPAENYAIKHGIHPADSTDKNIAKMKAQLSSIGAMFDWTNELRTSSPEYYRWTQWLFLKLYKNKIAYRKEAMVNWDPVDQTVLANEQVLADGTSERSGATVEQKPLKQWFFKITDYAEELLDFNNLDWPRKTVLMQKNWIGKSEGAEILFKVDGLDLSINVYTTRPDTIYGSTYLVISPESSLLNSIVTDDFKDAVDEYCEKAKLKNELERTDLNKDKTGTFTGSYAINPLTDKKIPIWVADYVLSSYGTGSIMAVPGHDCRDYEFADKYGLEIIEVVGSEGSELPFTGDGLLINSDILNGLSIKDAKRKIISHIENLGLGYGKTNYKLKDWLISRQRYWGTPIPIVYDPDGNPHPVPEEHLPWELPDDVDYNPKGTSPLGSSKSLIDRTEKIFGKGWTPEIDTMDTFVCSSWYYLRYPNSNYTDGPFDTDLMKWLPVDTYVGGAEHATMHLLYARFITKALRDFGYLSFDEPFLKLFHQGTITKDGSKMSKSKGNTVSPDEFIDQYGSDTFRAYLMFMGPFDEGGDWNDKGITGIYRFLGKVWRTCVSTIESDTLSKEDSVIVNKTIKGVSEDFESMKFNTAISKLMQYINNFTNKDKVHISVKETLAQLLSPIAPHMCEEIWGILGKENSIFDEPWLKYDESLVVDDIVVVVIQVNGKVRGKIEISKDSSKDAVLGSAKSNKNVNQHISGKEIVKEVYVPGRLVNFVVK
tara:strand:- start:642 stop:3035 length:2394 start_codon:yes stop_codon:yes gene_type:complete